ncbi:uncharacterized protein [Amphiura filiformis]|uniref:uncharacterized protein n=1 Tax=Amphiura filiformis TaxID=82378 RepID=UPI003B20B80A
MGLFISKLVTAFQEFTSGGAPSRILMLGLDAAGKTTILYKIKLNETVTTIPTIGFNVETVTPMPGLTFTVWDVGGQERLRQLWHHYYQGTQGVIFVVDSVDKERLQEAKSELYNIIKSHEISPNVPVLIFANKQDLPGAQTAGQLIEQLDIRSLPGNPWHVQATCATTGEGVYEGLNALAKMVREFKKANRTFKTKSLLKSEHFSIIMGNLLSRLSNALSEFSIFQQNPCRIVMLGLDAAGKTTILYKLKLNELVNTIPTIGFNVETVTPMPGVTFTVWDVGGQEKIRALWRHYFIGTEGILFVVDSNDRERAMEAREELFRVITDDEMMPRVPVVVVANKQDQPASMTPSKLVELMDLQKLPGNPWHIQGTCALNGDGLDEAVCALAKMVKQYRKDHGSYDMRVQLKKALKDLSSNLAEGARALPNNIAMTVRNCSIFKRPESKIFIGGLDASGKTTFLYRLVLNETVTTIPTIGFNVETVNIASGRFTFWDVGGGDKIKPLYRHYYPGCEGILFMIDSTDKERIREARDDLHEMMKNDDMPPGIPLVVVANKQDMSDVIHPSELVDLLDLEQLSGNPWHIQAASAINGDGVTETINEMAKMIEQYKKDLHG